MAGAEPQGIIYHQLIKGCLIVDVSAMYPQKIGTLKNADTVNVITTFIWPPKVVIPYYQLEP